jgi:DNA-binding MarR family transcriptional regulator
LGPFGKDAFLCVQDIYSLVARHTVSEEAKPFLVQLNQIHILSELITSKTRLRLLLKFFSRPGVRGHLRGLADELGESTNSIRLELNKLEVAGLLKKETEGQKKVYSVDERNTFHLELVNLVSKFLGFDQIINDLLAKAGEIKEVYITGDYARGIDGGLIEVVVVGNIQPIEIAQIVNNIETKIGRKINLVILDSELNESNYDCILQLL